MQVGNPEMSYRWSFNTDEPDTGIFLFDAKTKNSKNLYIRPYSLQAGLTYYLKVLLPDRNLARASSILSRVPVMLMRTQLMRTKIARFSMIRRSE